MKTKIAKERKVWRWEIREGRKVVAGGYCATKRDAVNDARRASSVNIAMSRRDTGPSPTTGLPTEKGA